MNKRFLKVAVLLALVSGLEDVLATVDMVEDSLAALIFSMSDFDSPT